MNAETGGGLTEQERAELWRLTVGVEGHDVIATVERILADRDAALARVEALADDLETRTFNAPGLMTCFVSELRAALHPAPREASSETPTS